MKLRDAVGLSMLLMIGCSGSGDTGHHAVERDSAGIVIVQNRGPYPEWQLGSTPEVRIGVVEGDSAYQFSLIRFAGRLHDGRIVVADGSSRQVRWFTSEGRHRSSVGRRGGGPGEFGSLGSAILTEGDTLVVHDPRSRRLTWLSPEETVVRNRSVNEVPSGDVTLLMSTHDRAAFAVSSPTPDLREPGFNFTRDTLRVMISSTAGLDTILQRPGTEGALWVRFTGGLPTAWSQMTLPFARHVLAKGDANGFTLAVGDYHQLEIRDWSGDLLRIVRRSDAVPAPLTHEVRERYVRHAVDAAIRSGSDPDVAEQSARDRIEIIPAGHTFPTFDGLLSDAEDRIWLRDFLPPWSESPDHTWTVYGPDGRIERRVAIPRELTVMHVGREFVTGVVRDSLDVQYVVVYRLEKIGG